jgi:hypothetical protein
MSFPPPHMPIIPSIPFFPAGASMILTPNVSKRCRCHCRFECQRWFRRRWIHRRLDWARQPMVHIKRERTTKFVRNDSTRQIIDRYRFIVEKSSSSADHCLRGKYFRTSARCDDQTDASSTYENKHLVRQETSNSSCTMFLWFRTRFHCWIISFDSIAAVLSIGNVYKVPVENFKVNIIGYQTNQTNVFIVSISSIWLLRIRKSWRYTSLHSFTQRLANSR